MNSPTPCSTSGTATRRTSSPRRKISTSSPASRPLVQERLKTLRDAAPLVQFFFRKVDYDPADLAQKRMDEPGTLVAAGTGARRPGRAPIPRHPVYRGRAQAARRRARPEDRPAPGHAEGSHDRHEGGAAAVRDDGGPGT